MVENGSKAGDAAARRLRLGALAAAVLAGALGVSVLRQEGPGFFLKGEPAVAAPADAQAWLAAVREGKEGRAKPLAARLAGEGAALAMPDPDYLEWVAASGLGSRILTEPFDRTGYRRWRDALLAEEILAMAGKPAPEAVLAAILGRVKGARDAPLPGPAENRAVWDAGRGHPLDLLRLYTLVLTTAGLDVQVVAAHGEDGAMLHQFCEIRTGGKVWVADPWRGECREGRDTAGWLAALAAGEAGPLPPALKGRVRFISFHLPAEAADYRPGQQRLAQALGELLGRQAPRFGGNPRGRIEAWQKVAPPPAEPRFTYWRYPLEAVLADPGAPATWRRPHP